jgi:hypothetical protein
MMPLDAPLVNFGAQEQSTLPATSENILGLSARREPHPELAMEV